MNALRFVRASLAAAAIALVAGCSFKASNGECKTKSDCPQGMSCDRGFCIRTSSGGSAGQAGEGMMSGPQLGGDASTDSGGSGTGPAAGRGGRGGRGGSSSGTGGAGSPAAGSGGAGSGSPMDGSTPEAGTGAAGQSAPDAGPPAACSGNETRPCTAVVLGAAPGSACTMGSQTCENGTFGVCTPTVLPVTEACNGNDDDCDGRTDENTDEVCYPDGQAGCTFVPGTNVAMCKGLCRLGKRVCTGGKLQNCDAVIPVAEKCTETGTAADENCDGMIDENCMCTGSGPRACYTGPAGTAGTGKCTMGSQTCMSGALSACTGSVTPVDETCANMGADDNCDNTVDNIPGLDQACTVAANMGVCREGKLKCMGTGAAPVCVTPAAGTETCNDVDDDCDGKVDENVDKQNDVGNCGTCGKKCGAGEVCCKGTCTNTSVDLKNCGACGTVCSSGMPACCNGMCKDLLSDDNCGECNKSCGVIGSLIGLTCSCKLEGSKPECFALAVVCI